MFSKIKSLLGSNPEPEAQEPKKKFLIDLLTPEQREEMNTRAREIRQQRLEQAQDKRLDQAFEWAKSADLDEIKDPEERAMVQQIQDEEKARIKRGAEIHTYIETRTFTTDVTPDVLTKDDKLKVFGKRVFGVKMPKKKEESEEKPLARQVLEHLRKQSDQLGSREGES